MSSLRKFLKLKDLIDNITDIEQDVSATSHIAEHYLFIKFNDSFVIEIFCQAKRTKSTNEDI